MSTLTRSLLAILCLLPAACGAGAADPGATTERAAAGGCVNPTAGMVITTTTTLCAGNFAMSTPAGAAAVTIAANNVQVTCNGTRLVGPGPSGPGTSPNVGFKIVGQSGVTLLGCAANAFQYGALVQQSSSITFQSTHFDDNYTDASQDWVQDSIQGGGIRFDNVTGSSVKDSSAERNWNGIELRGGSGNLVNNMTADHCTNWGALVAGSNNNTISNSNFSWGIRGGAVTLNYPNLWYGQDTKDSAGMVIDAAATGNIIQNNNVTYGGDGIFIRSVIGACATGTQVIGNSVSFSPHNGIESWCDGGTFKNNTASSCDYGIWLGGSDSSTVVGNTANSNHTDGISVQVAEDRHSVYQDNTLSGNARAGLFLGGANYQNGVPPTAQDSRIWNSSHLLAQRNTFSSNGSYDIWMGTTHGVVMASNSLTASKVVTESGTTADIVTLGNFSGAAGRTPPTAALANPGTPHTGTPVTLDASGSRLSSSGGTLAFNWLVQTAGSTFAALPTPVFAGAGPSKKTITFTSAGYFDIDVTATDGFLGALASVPSVLVMPGGVRVGQTASTWTWQCQPGDDCSATAFSDDPAGIEGSAVHATTNAAFNIAFFTPAAKNLNLNASGYSKFGFFVKGNDPNGWQGGGGLPQLPQVVLGSPGGTITYEPASTILPNTADGWTFIEVPLAAPAGSGWTRTNAGGSLSQVNWIEIHADVWDAGFDIWFDAVSFY